MPRNYEHLNLTNEESEVLEIFFEKLESIEPSLRDEAEEWLKACWSINHKGAITEQDILKTLRSMEKKFGDMEQNFKKVEAWFLAENKKRPPERRYTSDQIKLLAGYNALLLFSKLQMFKYVAFGVNYISTTGTKSSVYHPGSQLQLSPLPLTSAFFNEKPVAVRPEHNPNHWNRGFDQYPQTYDESSEDIVERGVPRFGHKNVLDVGRGDGYFLSLVKQKLGGKVKTHGIGVIDFTNTGHEKIDDDRVRPAEILPWEWSNSMDTVFSNVSFEYFLFPELALREIIRVMKKSGSEAHLDVDSHFDTPVAFGYEPMLQILGISETDFTRIFKANFSAFQNKQTITELVEKIAQEEGINLRVEFDYYDKDQLIHLYIDKS